MKKYRIKFTALMISILFITSCSKVQHKANPRAVPESWYNSEPQGDAQVSKETNQIQEPENFEGSTELNNSITDLLGADSDALEEGDLQAQSLLTSELHQQELSPFASKPKDPKDGKPKDWVPWRAEYFMTDLSLTASGLIGALTFKGTSTVRAFWRKQGPKPSLMNQDDEPIVAQEETTNSEPVVLVTEQSSPEEMVKQLEPAIHAAVATGKINDTPVLRKNLLQTAKEFQVIATSIPTTTDELPWWVSRFRLDFMVDAAGRVEPVGMVGGEVRFRFEWHRIKKVTPDSNKSLMILSEREQKLRKSLKEFITATVIDINDAFENHHKFGFKAHQVRMGVGVSVKGNIGVVKGSAGVVGQIYFTRHIEKPKVYPLPEKTMNLAMSEESPILIIERNPSQEHLKYATQNKLMLENNTSDENENGLEEAVYRLERKKFRKGLQKAAKIGAYFAKRASLAKVKSWKIYELRTGFDASISGGLDLVTIVGSATAQISMFNENF